MIRKAKINDVKDIHSILMLNAQEGILLGRSLSDLYDQLRDFIVYVDPQDNSIVGTCALHICWDDIAEIRSLAVRENHKARGVGRQMVDACIAEALQIGIKKLFVLTYVPEFFVKLGFNPVDKSVLPHKVWSDCVHCIKFPDCDEEALMREIGKSS
jgi:amino-acid N-acetyltransferase